MCNNYIDLEVSCDSIRSMVDWMIICTMTIGSSAVCFLIFNWDTSEAESDGISLSSDDHYLAHGIILSSLIQVCVTSHFGSGLAPCGVGLPA